MRKKKSLILEAVHETAKDLYEAGVMDRVTMCEFDRLCLPAILLSERLRQRAIRTNPNQANSRI
jgi:putative transcriptional regulator